MGNTPRFAGEWLQTYQLLPFDVDATERYGAEVDFVAQVAFANTDGLTGQHRADEDEVATPPDLAVATYAPLDKAFRVDGVGDAVGIGPGRGAVDAGRRLEAEGLMRPFVVEDVAEGIEAQLLFAGRGRGWQTAIQLQGEVHALMPAVLLRVAWVDAVGPDPELD